MNFTPEFEQAFDMMEYGKDHVFLTGKAGTGKSTLLTYFRKMTSKRIVVLAPTGIAALNVGGQTIHSFFGFPPRPMKAGEIKKRKDDSIYKNLDAIVIDEISMVRADMLDNINLFLKKNGPRRDKAFGGIQMIMIGDLFQLPPVISSEVEQQLLDMQYYSPFFFSAYALQGAPLQCYELSRVFRQLNQDFVHLLNQVRVGNAGSKIINALNKAYRGPYGITWTENTIILTATNYMARKINENRLNRLPSKLFSYKGIKEGEVGKMQLPTDEILTLKVDAQVMFVRNDMDGRWVNGTLARICELGTDYIMVEIVEADKVQRYDVQRDVWEMRKYSFNQKKQEIESEVVGSFEQYPIRLAWAVTIHKSQGKTFENIVIDLGRGAFAAGQVYVALSRCTTLQGISLTKPLNPSDIFADEKVVAFAHENGIYS